MVTETQTITEQVEVYKALPETLTTPVDYPVVAFDGEITVDDLLDLVFDFYDLIDVVNADRESAAELTQPKEPEPIPE